MARHRSETERTKWVSRWRASGLSCKQFAHKHGLSSATLYRWSQQVDGAIREAPPRFAEVRVVGASLGAALEVQHPGGCVVRVSGRVNEAQLTAVLRALGSC